MLHTLKSIADFFHISGLTLCIIIVIIWGGLIHWSQGVNRRRDIERAVRKASNPDKP